MDVTSVKVNGDENAFNSKTSEAGEAEDVLGLHTSANFAKITNTGNAGAVLGNKTVA